MSAPTAHERVELLLSVLPWLANRSGATLDEICEHFGCDREILSEDLNTVYYNVEPRVGPDEMIEVDINNGFVEVRLADYFREPLQLDYSEALMLLAAGSSRLAQARDDPQLESAVMKLANAIGERATEAVAVDPGAADPEVLAVLKTAAANRQVIRIDYFTYGRDSLSTREVEPYEIRSVGGHWYLSGYCRTATALRHFRIDRVLATTVVRSVGAFDPPDEVEPPKANLTEGGKVVELRVPVQMSWLLEDAPVLAFSQLGDSIHAEVAIHGDAWLDRLLLRLGPDSQTRLKETGESMDWRRIAAAKSIISRYDRSDLSRPTGSITQ